MKSLITSMLAAALLLGSMAHGQQMEFLPGDVTPPQLPPKQEGVKYTLLKPNDKTSEQVQDAERNPFGKSASELEAQNTRGTNEENQISDLLGKLRVVGVSPGVQGLRVMLGDMVLEQGQLVPQVLPEQTVALRVANITSDAINLVWVEKKPTGLPPRILTIAVDLRPYVRVQLQGQSDQKNQWEKQAEDTGDKAVTRQFPGTQPTAASSSDYASRQRDARTPPKAQPVAEGSGRPGERPAATTEAAVPAATKPPEEKATPEWDQAMKLLQKLTPSAPQNP